MVRGIASEVSATVVDVDYSAAPTARYPQAREKWYDGRSLPADGWSPAGRSRGHDLAGGAGGEPPARSDASATVFWTGPVGVLSTGHKAGGIVKAVARSGRPVHVLA